MDVNFNNSRGYRLRGNFNDVAGDHCVITVGGYGKGINSRGSRALSLRLRTLEVPCLHIAPTGTPSSEGKLHEQTVWSTIDDVICALNEMQPRGFKQFSLAGSSLGALAVMAVTKHYPIERLALKSPGFNYFERIEHYRELGRVKEKDQHYFAYKDPHGVTIKMSHNFLRDSEKYSNQVPEVPTLIVHGIEDVTFPYDEVVEWSKQLPDAQVVGVKGATHWWSGDNHIRAIDTMARWLAGHPIIEELPLGARAAERRS